MSTVDDRIVPMPAGAVDVSEWTDAGTPDEYRCFTGPTPYMSGSSVDWFAEDARCVTVFGTQLRDGTVEFHCIRLVGVSWEDELDSETARTIGKALIDAADDLDRLGQR